MPFNIKFTRQGLRRLGLPSDSTGVLKAEPGTLDIERRKPCILFIGLSIVSLFKLAIMMYFLCRFSVIGDVIQKVQRHHDLIMAHALS